MHSIQLNCMRVLQQRHMSVNYTVMCTPQMCQNWIDLDYETDSVCMHGLHLILMSHAYLNFDRTLDIVICKDLKLVTLSIDGIDANKCLTNNDDFTENSVT